MMLKQRNTTRRERSQMQTMCRRAFVWNLMLPPSQAQTSTTVGTRTVDHWEIGSQKVSQIFSSVSGSQRNAKLISLEVIQGQRIERGRSPTAAAQSRSSTPPSPDDRLMARLIRGQKATRSRPWAHPYAHVGHIGDRRRSPARQEKSFEADLLRPFERCAAGEGSRRAKQEPVD